MIKAGAPAVAVPGCSFHHEIDARRHALWNLTLLGSALAIGIVVAFVLSPHFGSDWLFVVGCSVLLGVNFSIFAFVFLPLTISGGTYRVTIIGKRLRVESPHWIFGKSFDVLVGEIERLVIRKSEDSPDRHDIVLWDARRFRLDAAYSGKYLPAAALFEAIRALDPDVELKTEQ